MVQFAKQLVQSSVVEWREYYVPYKKLKKILKKKIASEVEKRESSTLHQSSQATLTSTLQGSTRESPVGTRGAYEVTISNISPPTLLHLNISPTNISSPAPAPQNPSTVPLYSLCLALNDAGSSPFPLSATFNTDGERDFFEMLLLSLGKAEWWYTETLQEYEGRISEMERHIKRRGWGDDEKKNAQTKTDLSLPLVSTSTSKLLHETKKLRLACIEVYRVLSLLTQFASDNVLACEKILKKHDKIGKWDSKALFMQSVGVRGFEMAKVASGDKNGHLEQVKIRTEYLFVEIYKITRKLNESDSKQSYDASKDLRSQALTILRDTTNIAKITTHSDWDPFWCGVYTGLMMPALVLVVAMTTAHVEEIRQFAGFFVNWPTYRGTFLLLLHGLGFSFCMEWWKLKRINYRFILDFDITKGNRVRLSSHQLCRIVLGLSVILFYSLSVNIGIANNTGPLWSDALFGKNDIPELFTDPVFWNYVSVGFYCLFILTLVNPLNILHRSARYVFLNTLKNVVLSPLTVVNFREFFFADQVTSQVTALVDIATAACVYPSGIWLNAENDADVLADNEGCKNFSKNFKYFFLFLPHYWRFMQCMRRWIVSGHDSQKYNAGKYAVSMVTQLLSILDKSEVRIFWAISACVSTLYSYYWDIVHDWGLCKNLTPTLDRKKKFLLRDDLMIGSRKFYYWAMFSNFVLRITWVFTISPETLSGLHPDFLLLLFGALEVLRRNQWNLLRLEYEHVLNCERKKVIKHIEMPFLKSKSTKSGAPKGRSSGSMKKEHSAEFSPGNVQSHEKISYSSSDDDDEDDEDRGGGSAFYIIDESDENDDDEEIELRQINIGENEVQI